MARILIGLAACMAGFPLAHHCASSSIVDERLIRVSATRGPSRASWRGRHQWRLEQPAGGRVQRRRLVEGSSSGPEWGAFSSPCRPSIVWRRVRAGRCRRAGSQAPSRRECDRGPQTRSPPSTVCGVSEHCRSSRRRCAPSTYPWRDVSAANGLGHRARGSQSQPGSGQESSRMLGMRWFPVSGAKCVRVAAPALRCAW